MNKQIKSETEKEEVRQANIAYNQKIAAMTKREYLEYRIALFEKRLALPISEIFARVCRIDIEVSRQELARLK